MTQKMCCVYCLDSGCHEASHKNGSFKTTLEEFKYQECLCLGLDLGRPEVSVPAPRIHVLTAVTSKKTYTNQKFLLHRGEKINEQ